MSTQQETQILYERLGGVNSIAVVVDDLIGRLAAIESRIDPYYRAQKEVQYVE